MNATEEAVAQRLRDLLASRVALRELVLFGSRARGDGDPESDMDVLVVLEDGAGRAARKAVSACAWEAGFELGVVVVPVIFTRSEWEDGPERSSTLAQRIRAEGVRL